MFTYMCTYIHEYIYTYMCTYTHTYDFHMVSYGFPFQILFPKIQLDVKRCPKCVRVALFKYSQEYNLTSKSVQSV